MLWLSSLGGRPTTGAEHQEQPTMKKKLTIFLPALFVAGLLPKFAAAQQPMPADTAVHQSPKKFSPYFSEPLPLSAPEWMRQIAESPSGDLQKYCFLGGS